MELWTCLTIGQRDKGDERVVQRSVGNERVHGIIVRTERQLSTRSQLLMAMMIVTLYEHENDRCGCNGRNTVQQKERTPVRSTMTGSDNDT